MTKEKRKVSITAKEREFAHQYVKNNENGQKTAMEVFDIKNPNYAHVKAHKLVRKDTVAKEIETASISLKEAMIAEGITLEYISKKVNVLLKAKDADGNHDFTAIDKGLKHSLSIYGVANPDAPVNNGNTYAFIFSTKVQGEIKDINEKIKLALKSHVQPS